MIVGVAGREVKIALEPEIRASGWRACCLATRPALSNCSVWDAIKIEDGQRTSMEATRSLKVAAIIRLLILTSIRHGLCLKGTPSGFHGGPSSIFMASQTEQLDNAGRVARQQARQPDARISGSSAIFTSRPATPTIIRERGSG
ncbi:hypothetical protein NDU88_005239 [Pleurodeles waltl]|uniref:Uncharacterized protein n=1 Tax=Pleurodeles waltl TaxID=8319 RepID=A0AAV7WB83_PLEWA|nr:hypothetical protein NDU88_005239 [Pleurodeles waltl]